MDHLETHVLCMWSESFGSAGRFLEAFAQARCRTPSPRRKPGSSIKGLDSGLRRNDGNSYCFREQAAEFHDIAPYGGQQQSHVLCTWIFTLFSRKPDVRNIGLAAVPWEVSERTFLFPV